MEDERSDICHGLKLWTFCVESLGTGSGNMASDIVQANALGRWFAIFPLLVPSNSKPNVHSFSLCKIFDSLSYILCC